MQKIGFFLPIDLVTCSKWSTSCQWSWVLFVSILIFVIYITMEWKDLKNVWFAWRNIILKPVRYYIKKVKNMFAWIINKFELIRQLFVQINKSVLMCLFKRHDLEGLSRTCAGLKGEYELKNDSNYVTDSVTVVINPWLEKILFKTWVPWVLWIFVET